MAVPARRDTRMQVAAYRDWAATRPDDERWELIDGVPVMMSPAKGRYRGRKTDLYRSIVSLKLFPIVYQDGPRVELGGALAVAEIYDDIAF